MQSETSQIIVGRGPQLESMRTQLSDPRVRVLTLRGPGGVGKTTLARSVANERGAPFVELDVCKNVDDIASALGEALAIPDVLRTLEGVAQALREQDVPLVILDNAEHLVAAVEQVVVGWLETTGAQFLVTTRERLRIDGEIVVDIMPLEDDDALELFEIRAQEASRRFVLDESNRADVLRLIELVDGLPLALELAAARTKILSPAQICDRLDAKFEILRNKGEGVVDRHATLDACVEWSWDLLDDGLRDALRQVAIFRGRFSIDEAEQVVASTGWIGDELEELVERSLIWIEPSEDTLKFAMYDGVRRFVDRNTQPDDALIERYALFLRDRALGQVLRHQDLTNMLHAYELCIEDRTELAVELLLEARQKLWRAGFLSRLFSMLERALAIEGLDPMWRGALYASLAACHFSLMEYPQMLDCLTKASELVAGDDRAVARRVSSHIALLRGVRADEEHRLDEAEAYYEEAKVSIDVLPPAQQAHLFAACGLASLRRGHLARAISEFEDGIAAARKSPDSVLLARTLSWSSNGYIALQQMDRAISRLQEALEIYDEHDDVISRGVAEYGLAQSLIDKDLDEAKAMARRAQATAQVGRMRVLEAMTKVLVARLEVTDTSADTIRRAMRVFSEDSNHNDRWSAWISLIVVLVERGELDAAAQEASFLVATTDRVGTDREKKWVRGYHAAIHALRGDHEQLHAATDDDAFLDALERALHKGRVDDADLRAFEDPYLRFIHDRCPVALEIVDRVLATRVDRRDLRLIDDAASAVLPDGTEIELETRYVLKRLLVALCDVHDTNPGRALTLEDLVEAGWPDEQMTYESGIRRVYSAIRNLRKLGFEDIVLTGENGYLIDPTLRVLRE